MSALLIRHGRIQNDQTTSHIFRPIAILGCCIVAITSISMLDIWFAVQNESIMIVEKNPICLALMELDPGGFTYFIAGKVSGTMVVVATLIMLHLRKYPHAMKVAFGVVAFQIGLLIYLTLSDPTMYNLPNFGLLFADTRESIWELN